MFEKNVDYIDANSTIFMSGTLKFQNPNIPNFTKFSLEGQLNLGEIYNFT